MGTCNIGMRGSADIRASSIDSSWFLSVVWWIIGDFTLTWMKKAVCMGQRQGKQSGVRDCSNSSSSSSSSSSRLGSICQWKAAAAGRLLSAHASSCSSERNWSLFSNIFNKTNNCLALERAKKLSYISSNSDSGGTGIDEDVALSLADRDWERGGGVKGWEREDVSDVQGAKWGGFDLIFAQAVHFRVCNQELMVDAALVFFSKLWQANTFCGLLYCKSNWLCAPYSWRATQWTPWASERGGWDFDKYTFYGIRGICRVHIKYLKHVKVPYTVSRNPLHQGCEQQTFQFFCCEQNGLHLRCGRFAFLSTMQFENTGGGWQPRPRSGTLSYSVLPRFCINQKEIHIIKCSSRTSTLILITEVPLHCAASWTPPPPPH